MLSFLSNFSNKEAIKICICGIILGLLFAYFFVYVILWLFHYNSIWPINWCLYAVFVTAFHLSEFIITAVARPLELSFNSFLVNQSLAYEVAMITGMCEYWVEYWFLPILQLNVFTSWIGFGLCFCGGLLRAIAEIQMKGNFSHMIRERKDENHRLVKTGVYRVFRHPAYTGWFYFSIGTQILLNNPFCAVAYACASWYFFYKRIPYEESYLLEFFSDYDEYRKHSYVFIPFIPKVEPKLITS